MNPSLTEVNGRIVAMIAQCASGVRAQDIKPTHRLREDLGLDSVGSMELLSMLAEELDLDVPVEEAAQVSTVEATLALAHRYLAQKQA